MWCLTNPEIGERDVVAALLEHNSRLVRTGQVLLADKGFAGRQFKALTDAMGLRLLRPVRGGDATETYIKNTDPVVVDLDEVWIKIEMTDCLGEAGREAQQFHIELRLTVLD